MNDSPEESGDLLLNRWAVWNRDGGSGGSGYLKERLDPVHDGMPPQDVEKVEQILAFFKTQPWFRFHWKVVKHYYLGGRCLQECSNALTRPERDIKAAVKDITHWVSQRYKALTTQG